MASVLNDDDATGRAQAPAHESADTYQRLLRSDSLPVDDALAIHDFTDQGDEDFPVEPYLERSWFDQEIANVWKKTWQFACREDEVGSPGDYYVYDIVGMSLIISRGSDGQLRALHNFCQHRGRKLRSENGSASSFRCPFHGWTWNTEGGISALPCRSDFRNLSDDELALPQARIGTWGGFVFVCFDPDGPTLEAFLGTLPDHFKTWNLENCYSVAHVRKRIPCNWKVGVEAFIEAYHTLATHPQIAPYTGDTSTQVDTFEGESFNRMLTPMMIQSGQMEAPLEQQAIFDAITGGVRARPLQGVQLPEGETGRSFLAQRYRETMTATTGVDHSALSDADMLDVIQYFIFPNFFPWGGYTQNLVYQFRPDGKRIDSAILDVYMLRRFDPAGERPRSSPLNILSDDESWASASELAGAGPIFDQDMDNMGFVQEGMEIARATTGTIKFSRYHEARIRKFHRQLLAACGK